MTSWPGKNFSALGICEKTAEEQYYLAGIRVADMYEKYMIVFSLALSTWKRVKKHTHTHFFIVFRIQYFISTCLCVHFFF